MGNLPLWATVAAAVLQLLSLVWSAVPAESYDVDEVAVMRRLRQVLHSIDGHWNITDGYNDLNGTGTDGIAHPCAWENVSCDEQGHITYLHLFTDPRKKRVDISITEFMRASTMNSNDTALLGQMLPELARFEWLEELRVTGLRPLPTSIPPELQVINQAGPLPEFQPGAAPALMSLSVTLHTPGATLPVAWGRPDVLPALSELVLRLHLAGPLPPQWAEGFLQLRKLSVTGLPGLPATAGPSTASMWAAAGGAATAAAAGTPGQLPARWAQGFPHIISLTLADLGLSGQIPQEWQGGGFANLNELILTGGQLTGTLPPSLFQAHPTLASLMLDRNRFTGPLPDAWGSSMVCYLNLASNALSGPLFPPAWLQPGSMAQLKNLTLSNNSGLKGRLPDMLTWRTFYELELDGTGAEGTIPPAYCDRGAMHTANNRFHMKISNTAIGPILPSCLGSMFRDAGQPAGPSPSPAYPGAPSLGFIISAAAVGAAATTAAAGSLLLWRRRRLPIQHDERSNNDVEWQANNKKSLLASDPPQLCRRRHEHLAAQLKAELSGSNRCVEMFPLSKVLLRTLAHSVDSLGGGTSCSGGSRTSQDNASAAILANAAAGQVQQGPAEHADEEDCLLPQQRAFRSEQPWRWPDSAAGTATTLSLGSISDSGVSGSAETSGDSALLKTRHWRLDTHSLQLSPTELEFVVDEDGRPVELGGGSSAAVYLAWLWGKEVAVKVYELLPSMQSRNIWHEVSVLRQCMHDHIVPLLGVAMKGQLLMLAMPLLRGGTLRDALRSPKGQQQLRWHARGRQVALDIAKALAFLHHELGVMHSDVKSSNVLLDEEYRASLSDLGLSRFMRGATASIAGFSRYCAAPEQLMWQRCTLAADMYSFGVLMIELTTQEIVAIRGDWQLPRAPEHCPQGVLELICQCLSATPSQRPTAQEALQRLLDDPG